MCEREQTLNKREVYGNLFRVAIPIALQGLVASSLNLVDNLMVGALGESELAGVGVGIQIYFVAWIITFGFAGGCSTFVAQFWGVKDGKNIKKTIGFSAAFSLTVGTLFFFWGILAPRSIAGIFTDIPQTVNIAAEYIRFGSPCFLFMPLSVVFEMGLKATQQTKYPMFISIIAFSSNTFMNWVLIFGHFGMPAMGVKGAAIATAFSRLIEIILGIIIVFFRNNVLKGHIKEYIGWSRDLVMRIFKNSLPTMANEGLWALATTMYVAAYARVGITEYASYQAGETIARLFVIAAFSIGDAALILVGQKLGQRKDEEAYELAALIIKLTTVIGLIFGGALLMCGKPLIGLYNFSPEGGRIAFLILVVDALTMVFYILNGVIISGILRSGGDTWFAMILDCGTIWLIGVPLAFISTGVFRIPIYMAVLICKTEEVVKLALSLKRFFSKKWARSVIKDIKQ